MDGLVDDRLVIPPLLIIVGLLGIVVPVLPGLLLILGGVLLWAALEGGTNCWLIFAASLLVAVIGWVLQYTLPGKRMRDRGVSNSTLAIAVMVGIVGFLVVPVVGAIIGFVLAIFVVEYLRSKDTALAWSGPSTPSSRCCTAWGSNSPGLTIAALFVGGLVAT